jgi:hypothetical protein
MTTLPPATPFTTTRKGIHHCNHEKECLCKVSGGTENGFLECFGVGSVAVTNFHHSLPPEVQDWPPQPPATPPLLEGGFSTATMRRNAFARFLVAQRMDSWSDLVLGVLLQPISTTHFLPKWRIDHPSTSNTTTTRKGIHHCKHEKECLCKVSGGTGSGFLEWFGVGSVAVTYFHHSLPPQVQEWPPNHQQPPPLLEREFTTANMRRNASPSFLVVQRMDSWSAFVLGVLL